MSDTAHIWEEKGNIEKAVECYKKSLEADNLAEGFYRRLMLCYHKLGRQAEAIEVYERCRKTFFGCIKSRAIYRNNNNL
jgi:DNA-binding transcriptional activator of the SARP family